MNRNSAQLLVVAQIFNLLYRRFLICWAAVACRRPVAFRALADCKSAIQQSATLRYAFGQSAAYHSLFILSLVRRREIFGLSLAFIFALTSCFAGAQTDLPARPNTDLNASNAAVRAEQLRAVCLQGRRCVCGRVLKVFPNGVLVESGYPSLLRDALHGAWHLPGTVIASRPANLVETQDPDGFCVGVVFLTDLPKLRGGKKEHIEPYDYVVLHSYSAGQYTYTSVGGIQRTVRRFAGGLETAVNLIIQEERANAVPIPK